MNGRAYRIAKDARRAGRAGLLRLHALPRRLQRACSADVVAALRPLDPGTRGKVQVLFVTVDPGGTPARPCAATWAGSTRPSSG